MAERGPALSILIPVRNEGVNIVIMLRILRAVLDIPHEVLIVYDAPDDLAIATVQKHFPSRPEIRLIQNLKGKGVSWALQAGMEAAQGETVLLFAVDEVGPVLAIKDMYALIREGCDFVSCTRYAHGGRRLGGSLIGAILSRIANISFKALSGCGLTDSTTGVKMFRKSFAQAVKFEAKPVGWAVAYEMSIKAEFQGLRLGEVPIISIDRLYGGESTFSIGPWMKEYLRWFFWGIKALRGRGPRPPAPQVSVRVPKWDADYFEEEPHAARR